MRKSAISDTSMYLSLVACVMLAAGGCGGEGGPGGPGPGPEDMGPLGDSPTIKQVMVKLAKGPNALTPVIGKELQADPPSWETIQPRAKEYARLAAAMGKNDPPKGTKESWNEFSTAYADSAAALDRAAQAKDRKAALEAHGQLAGSCTQCHKEHRRMGRGPGGGPPPS